MQIRIFDVGLGFCGLIRGNDGSTLLIDCGHNAATGFYPSDYLIAQGIPIVDRFFVTNYDEDHVSGLPRLRNVARLPIRTLHRNRSVTPAALRAMKATTGGMGPGLSALVQLMDEYTYDESPGLLNPPFEVFGLTYPEFADTNNLSLALFVQSGGISILFPGDLEQPGLRRLLQDGQFLRRLAAVNILVAPHHGRTNAYVPELFNVCTPDIVIISDEEMKYDTQEHCYDRHARGITWNGTEIRKVLTTRSDGTISISSTMAGNYFIQTAR
jgi:beta-lactamase superfamily II metal-dependent hydrolase